MSRAIDAGVLAPLLSELRRAGHPTPDGAASIRLTTAARHMTAMLDLAFMGGLLDGAGVAWALTKGPVLRDVVFERPSVRDYTDLDVLVHPQEAGRAIDLLLAHGCLIYPCDLKSALRARTAELTLTLPHGTVLDLHWSLINVGDVRERYHLSATTFLARRVERAVDGQVVWTLDDLDLSLHVLLHACLSGGWSLRWLLDAQQCLRWLDRVSTHADLVQRCREHGLTAPAIVVVEAAVRYVDADLTPWRRSLGAGTLWTAVVAAASRARPPSAPSQSARTAGTYFAATGERTATSFTTLAQVKGRQILRSRAGSPPITRAAVASGDPLLRRLLVLAEEIGE